MGNTNNKQHKIKMTQQDFNQFIINDKKNIDTLKKKYNIPTENNENIINSTIKGSPKKEVTHSPNDNSEEQNIIIDIIPNPKSSKNSPKTKKNKQKYKNKPTFDTFIEALYDAGIKAQRNVQIANLYHLDWFFEDKDDNGVLEPRMIKIKVPSGKNDDKWNLINIPLISLINHNSIKINTMNVEFKINLGELTLTKHNKDINENHSHAKYIPSIDNEQEKSLMRKKWKINISTPTNNNKQCAKVNVEFKYDNPLESIKRLVERYDRYL